MPRRLLALLLLLPTALAAQQRPDALQLDVDRVVHGRQTHGALPATGVDPIVIGSQIVLGLQTVISRQVNLMTASRPTSRSRAATT